MYLKSCTCQRKGVQMSDNGPCDGLVAWIIRLKLCRNSLPGLTSAWTYAPPLLGPQRRRCVQSMRPQEILLGSSTKGLPSEDRVRADTSAVQDFSVPHLRTMHEAINILKLL